MYIAEIWIKKDTGIKKNCFDVLIEDCSVLERLYQKGFKIQIGTNAIDIYIPPWQIARIEILNNEVDNNNHFQKLNVPDF